MQNEMNLTQIKDENQFFSVLLFTPHPMGMQPCGPTKVNYQMNEIQSCEIRATITTGNDCISMAFWSS